MLNALTTALAKYTETKLQFKITAMRPSTENLQKSKSNPIKSQRIFYDWKIQLWYLLRDKTTTRMTNNGIKQCDTEYNKDYQKRQCSWPPIQNRK